MQEVLIRRLESMTPTKTGGEAVVYPLEQAVADARQVSQLLDDALTESRALMRAV